MSAHVAAAADLLGAALLAKLAVDLEDPVLARQAASQAGAAARWLQGLDFPASGALRAEVLEPGVTVEVLLRRLYPLPVVEDEDQAALAAEAGAVVA